MRSLAALRLRWLPDKAIIYGHSLIYESIYNQYDS